MLFHSEFIQNIINALNKEADIKNIGIRGHNLTKSPPASPWPLTHAHTLLVLGFIPIIKISKTFNNK